MLTKFLFLDDIMWDRDWPGIDDSSEEKKDREKEFHEKLVKCLDDVNSLSHDIRMWRFYRSTRPDTDNSQKTFSDYIKDILNKKKKVYCQDIGSYCKQEIEIQKFTHILVDWKLDETGQYTGLNLIRDLKEWFDKNLTDDKDIIPELLVLSRNPATVTIQSALGAGANGYIIKENIETLPLVTGRAGQPLKVRGRKIITVTSHDLG